MTVWPVFLNLAANLFSLVRQEDLWIGNNIVDTDERTRLSPCSQFLAYTTSADALRLVSRASLLSRRSKCFR
jgi:hypothetical protein